MVSGVRPTNGIFRCAVDGAPQYAQTRGNSPRAAASRSSSTCAMGRRLVFEETPRIRRLGGNLARSVRAPRPLVADRQSGDRPSDVALQKV
jgi:hypothetical protein